MLDPLFWRDRRVLLTGHTGFKGSWLLLWLRQLGAEVWGYALDPSAEANLFDELLPDSVGPDFHDKRLISDFDSLGLGAHAQPEVVFHLLLSL